MPTVPDWVLDSKLETHFPPGSKYETVHTYYQQESLSRRPIKTSEHWQREKKIGDGGFGEVWLERRTKGNSHGHNVRAIKQMDVRRQVDYGRELEAIAKFSHKKYKRCFVESLGWYQTEARLFIAMEYLELGDLQDYLHGQKQPLPEFEVQRIMSQILEGLDLMHENGYAHRDLKPNNILLGSCPPNDWWVKIADFGISKRIEDGSGKPSTRKGTEGFIAPEIYDLTERGTLYAIDLWAAGEIMFRLLTKQPAFKHFGLLFNYVKTPDIFPSDQLLANEVSQFGVEFVLSLMHPTPAGRMSAKDALQHRWIDQILPYNRQSAPLAYKEAHTTLSLDSVTEQLASWNTIQSPESPTTSTPDLMTGQFASSNTIKPPEAFETFIPRRAEELGTPSLLMSSHKTVKFQPAERKGAAEVRIIPPRTLEGHSWYANSVAFSPDGKLVASWSGDSTVNLWNTITGAIHQILEPHSDSVGSVAFSSDGKLVASGCYDNTIKLWDTKMGTSCNGLGSHSSRVTCVAFSPDGNLVASGSDDYTVKLWYTTGAVYKTLGRHSNGVSSVAFSPDGKLVASGCYDNTIKLWDTKTGTTLRTLEGHSRWVTSVAFSSDGKLVASGSDDYTVKLWYTTGAIYKTLKGHSNQVQSVTFSPDGKLVASTSLDSMIRLWDTTTGAVRKMLEGHSDQVQSVAFSPDGKVLAFGSSDKALKLWDNIT